MDHKEQSKTHFEQVGVDIGQGRHHEEMVYGIALVYTEMFKEITIYLKKHGLSPDQMNALMLIKHQGLNILILSHCQPMDMKSPLIKRVSLLGLRLKMLQYFGVKVLKSRQ